MSKAINSPTARMLRSSRLFSMPSPLPPPSMDQVAFGMVKTSDTATHPYPTKQAITSPASSRHRGDWGLKRPLPPKTNNTSTPAVRINAMDTLEHITDFDSAADHTVTYVKWQEMSIPMTIAPKLGHGRYPVTPPPTAFNAVADHTILRDERGQTKSVASLPVGLERALRVRRMKRTNPGSDDQAMRWKFDGPYLPSMTKTEFEHYVTRVVESPELRKQFRKFLLVVRAEEKRHREIEKMRKDMGFDANRREDVEQLDQASRITDPEKEVDDFILELRDRNDDLSAELSRLIGEFFDLPPFPKNRSDADSGPGANLVHKLGGERDSQPAPTHPSAGLSYIRTGAFMENHPLHGPQLGRIPVEARILRPRQTAIGHMECALLGIGGFAAKDITRYTGRPPKDPDSVGNKVNSWNFDVEGGQKIWANPTYAFVDEMGKVRISVDYPDNEATAVRTGIDPRPAPVLYDDAEARERYKQLSNAANSHEGTTEAALAPSLNVKTTERAKAFNSHEVKQFQKMLKNKKPGQDIGRGLLAAMAAKRQNRV